jgi:charged multivesicular body protein 2A
MNFFAPKKTAEEVSRETDRALRKVDRDLERDRRKIESEEKKIEAEIKRLAKVPGQQDTVKTLALQLVRLRKQKTRSVVASSKV